jgi:hypothetical protein
MTQLAFATASLHIQVVPPKRRRPALRAEELRHLAKSFKDVARRAHKVGEVQKAERFERKARTFQQRPAASCGPDSGKEAADFSLQRLALPRQFGGRSEDLG